MRQRKKIQVTRGLLTGEGATKTEAKADLEKKIDRALAESGVWIETRYGCVLIVSRTVNGYETKVIFPDQISEHGKRHWAGVHWSNTDLKPCVLAVRTHAAQSMWNSTVNDEEHIAAAGLENTPNQRELESWIRFQRSYIAAKERGLNDAQAFNAASGLTIAA